MIKREYLKQKKRYDEKQAAIDPNYKSEPLPKVFQKTSLEKKLEKLGKTPVPKGLSKKTRKRLGLNPSKLIKDGSKVMKKFGKNPALAFKDVYSFLLFLLIVS